MIVVLLFNNTISPENQDVQTKIQNGDYSCMSDWDEYGYLYEKYGGHGGGSENWVVMDINEDGIDDLMWMDDLIVSSENERMIFSIFLCYEDTAKCIHWDLNDMTEYLYLSKNKNIIEYGIQFGATSGSEGFFLMKADENEELKRTYGLVIYDVYGEKVKDNILSFEKVTYENDGTHVYEEITKEEFLTEFQKMTGYEYVNEVFHNW